MAVKKGGPGASGRVLPPVTGRFRVRVAVSLHCTGEGKACHLHPSPDPAQSGSSLHWVRPLKLWLCIFIALSVQVVIGSEFLWERGYIWANVSNQFCHFCVDHICYVVLQLNVSKHICCSSFWNELLETQSCNCLYLMLLEGSRNLQTPLIHFLPVI